MPLVYKALASAERPFGVGKLVRLMRAQRDPIGRAEIGGKVCLVANRFGQENTAMGAVGIGVIVAAAGQNFSVVHGKI